MIKSSLCCEGTRNRNNTTLHFNKPFDKKFHKNDCMQNTSKNFRSSEALMKQIGKHYTDTRDHSTFSAECHHIIFNITLNIINISTFFRDLLKLHMNFYNICKLFSLKLINYNLKNIYFLKCPEN